MFNLSFLRHKLTRDIAWTMTSLLILATSGIVINIVVATFRDAAALGVFNQAYAIYIVASQIAACGLHYSVLRHSALHESNGAERGRLLLTAIVCALMMGCLGALVVVALAPWLGAVLDSQETGDAIQNAAWGLALFPLNKVLLAYLNGMRLMRAFSILQAGRYVLVTCAVAIVAASELKFAHATLGFVVAELATSVVAIAYLIRRRMLGQARFDHGWLRRHVAFGSKSLFAGLFVEMNSRVDVLMIGLFLTDADVGVYSFAAMLVDGLYHVLAVVRINFNPVLVGAVRDGDWGAARQLLRLAKRYGYPLTAMLAGCILVLFWVMATYIVPAKGLQAGFLALAILLSGLTLISALIPFDNLMMVTGHPGWQTLQHFAVVASNILLCWLLLPAFGIEGAAIGTAASYLIGIGVLLYLTRRMLSWDLLTNAALR